MFSVFLIRVYCRFLDMCFPSPLTFESLSSLVFRMSMFDQLTPLIPQVSSSGRQSKMPLTGCLSPPASLSSPIIKKKPIQIPAFDERGLVCTKEPNTDRWHYCTFVLLLNGVNIWLECYVNMYLWVFMPSVLAADLLCQFKSRHAIKSQANLSRICKETMKKERQPCQESSQKHSALHPILQNQAFPFFPLHIWTPLFLAAVWNQSQTTTLSVWPAQNG